MSTVPFSKAISSIYFPPLCGINWALDGSCLGANQLQGAAGAGGSHFVAGSIGGADLSPNVLTVGDKEYRVPLTALHVSSNGTVALMNQAPHPAAAVSPKASVDSRAPWEGKLNTSNRYLPSRLGSWHPRPSG